MRTWYEVHRQADDEVVNARNGEWCSRTAILRVALDLQLRRVIAYTGNMISRFYGENTIRVINFKARARGITRLRRARDAVDEGSFVGHLYVAAATTSV